jgi:hypothetical protein
VHAGEARGLFLVAVVALALLLPVLPAPAGADPAPSGVGVSGLQLTLNGVPHNFTGVDAYELATDWGVNYGCGAMLSDAQLASFFASLPPGSLVRFNAFQANLGTDAGTGALDLGPLDRVFAAAQAAGDYLIPVLADQWGDCDGGNFKDLAWYQGGYQQVQPAVAGQGLQPLSYLAYVTAVVQHFAGNPALGMWEPIGEAEASTCPPADEPLDCSGNQICPSEATAEKALLGFFTTVGQLIHGLDPGHLVESGLLGAGQCGTQGTDYRTVSASPGIDVLSYHDYYASNQAEGGDVYNGIAKRLSQARLLVKPIIAGEDGILAGNTPDPTQDCVSYLTRTADMEARLGAQLAGGTDGWLVWNWVPAPSGSCSYDTGPGDPLLTLLDSFNPDQVPPTLAVTPPGTQSLTVGQPFVLDLQAGDGLAPYLWTVSVGTLPLGLALDPSGVLAGIPLVRGSATVTVTVTDLAGESATSRFTLKVAPA